MPLAQIDDEAFRGDTLEFEVAVAREGTPVNFGTLGTRLWCTGKKRRTDPDTSADFQVTEVQSDQGWVRQTATGTLLVTLTPAATWPLRGAIQVDVQYMDPSDESEWTVASGQFNFLLDVTRTTLTPLPAPAPGFTLRDKELREYVQEIMGELDPGGSPPP